MTAAPEKPNAAPPKADPTRQDADTRALRDSEAARKRAEDALAESEARLRIALGVGQLGSWQLDPATGTLDCTALCKTSFGLPGDAEVSYERLFELIHPDDRQRVRAALDHAIATHTDYDTEHRVVWDDGSIHTIAAGGRAFYGSNGELVRLVGLTADITEREQAEASSEERYRTLFSSIDEGFCVVEVLFDDADRPRDYRFLEINPAFEKQTGIESGVGRRMREIAPAHEEHWFEIYGRVALTGEPVRFQNQAAALGRWFDVYAFRIGPPEMRRVAILFNDISERRRVEQALVEANRRKDEFLATLAHELRNPLAPIRNGLRIMRLEDGDEQAIAAASDMVERQVGQMVRLVDELLDVSRISRGKIELRKERLDLVSVVDHAAEAARPLCQDMDHELTVTLPPAPITRDGDATRLAQVVGNLLNNACKFTKPGGRIQLGVEREAKQAVIRVRDNGMGIDADHLPCLFEMFTQVDTSLERSQSGLGIGLTLVKNLVEMHDGTVQARSDGIGHGSEFVVRLPVLPEPAAPPQPASGDEQGATLPRRILVVDDSRDAASSLAMLLELSGHEVHTAHDGLEAVQAAANVRPDVILLDIGLPRLNGYDACRRIREQPRGGNVFIVALTGWGQEEDRRRSGEAGFDGHLVKPVDLTDLEKLLAAKSGSSRL